MTPLIAVGVATVFAGAAWAADQTVTGRLVKIRDVAEVRRSVDLKVRDPNLVLPATLPNGQDTRFRIWSASGEFGFHVMNDNWVSRANGKTFKVRDRTRRESATIKDGSLRLKVPLPESFTLDEASQGTIGLSLTAGDVRYCAEFAGAIVTDEPGRFVAKEALAPASCPDLCADDVADPTVSITDFFETPPCCGDADRFTLIVADADDRELHHLEYVVYDLVGCPTGTACDAACWTRGASVDATSSTGSEVDMSEGTFAAPGCAKCIDVTVTAIDSCGRTSAEAVLRTPVSCPNAFCCS